MARFEDSAWLVRWLFFKERFEFDWDAGNISKSKRKHAVETHEAEAAFYDDAVYPLGVQTAPAVNEPRFGILGKTFGGRALHVVFTIRRGRVRVISARPMHRSERDAYDQAVREE